MSCLFFVCFCFPVSSWVSVWSWSPPSCCGGYAEIISSNEALAATWNKAEPPAGTSPWLLAAPKTAGIVFFYLFLYPVLAAACWKFLLLTAGWLQDVSRWMICHQVIDRLQAVASTNHTPTTVAQQHSDGLIVFHVLSVFSTLTRERQKKNSGANTKMSPCI